MATKKKKKMPPKAAKMPAKMAPEMADMGAGPKAMNKGLPFGKKPTKKNK